MKILDDQVILRPLQVSDAEHVYTWTGDPLVTEALFWDHHPNLSATVDFLQKVATKHPWFMAICLNEKPVGAITLDRGNGRAEKRAELGYVLARAYWGQGITTIAVKKALQKGFRELPILRIESFVDPENRGSVRVLEKSEMKKEAYLSKYLVHRGLVRDRIIFGAVK